MDGLMYLVDVFFHVDKHLLQIIKDYGVWVYAILFLVIFCETGLVVFPFLPGDSLLFVAGALAASEGLDIHAMAWLLWLAAVLGDNLNYWIGRRAGMRLFRNPNSRLFRRDYLERAQWFYRQHGGKTVFLARFLPVVRTFAPFVAGMSGMPYRRFVVFSVTGAAAWCVGLSYLGYFFGNIPIIKNNLSLFIVLGVCAVPVMGLLVKIGGRLMQRPA